MSGKKQKQNRRSEPPKRRSRRIRLPRQDATPPLGKLARSTDELQGEVTEGLPQKRAVGVIVVSGIVAYATGLFNGFLGDDSAQIVNATPVHSLGNIVTFFQGSTFYPGTGSALSGGAFYRPMQTVVYSLIYTIFGATPFVFHLVQISLHIGSAVLLYLVFRYWFRPAVALTLAMLFLLHPINSQVAYLIPAMGDALFFFFGILALWLVLRSDSTKSLLLAVGCLFVSLLSKESGVVFVGLVLLYLLMFDRQRLVRCAALMVVPVAIWFLLKLHAVGFPALNDAPIDQLDLGGRLMTVPSILLLYLRTLVWPVSLASSYYWVNPSLSFGGVVLPLLIDVAVIVLAIYVGVLVRRRGSSFEFRSYLFFGITFLAAMALYIQIFPLDLTAADTWVYLPFAALLGMVGVAASVLLLPRLHTDRRTIALVVIAVLVLCGLRTAMRGLDYSDGYSLALLDTQAAPGNYVAEAIIANHLTSQGDFADAKNHAEISVGILPYPPGLEALGDACYKQADYACARDAYVRGANYGNIELFIDNAARAMIFAGNPTDNEDFLKVALQRYPQDPILWGALAITQYQHGDPAGANASVREGYQFDQGAWISYLYKQITAGQPLKLTP